MFNQSSKVPPLFLSFLKFLIPSSLLLADSLKSLKLRLKKKKKISFIHYFCSKDEHQSSKSALPENSAPSELLQFLFQKSRGTLKIIIRKKRF